MAVETHPRIAARTGDAALPAKSGDAELGDMFSALLTGATLPEEEGAAPEGEGEPALETVPSDETEAPVDPLIGIALATISADHPVASAKVSAAEPGAPAKTAMASQSADADRAPVKIAQPTAEIEAGDPKPTDEADPAAVAPSRTRPFIGPQVSLPVDDDGPAKPSGKPTVETPVSMIAPQPQPQNSSATPTPGTRPVADPQVMRPVEGADATPKAAPQPTGEQPKPAATETAVAPPTIGKTRILAEPPVMRPTHDGAQPAAAQPATPPQQQAPDPAHAPQTALQAILAQAGLAAAPDARGSRIGAAETPKLAKAIDAIAATTPGTAAPVAQPLPESLQMMVAPVQQPQAIDVRAAAPASQPQPLEQLVEQQLDLAHESEWLDRLTRDIAGAGAKDGTMRFRLAPEHLGNLHVELKQQAAGAAIRLTAETEAARAILADAHPRLIAEARAQGVRIAEAHVDLGSGRSPQQEAADQRRQDQPGHPAGQSVLRGKKSVTNSALTMTPRTADRFA
ncbi:flagellar hook-length control protein FliK [Allosphingosinicella indica]|uniref:Hook-length control protein FliK n=1 Tax=Allosphingosinicella indica TaxID=941907 RepID=A0A1X7GPC6_9SPHN|nr:flagellar hook-length control protein FliK [Allosphingosinicella indica]SMF72628.1 hook-length control protein FliK [Allosphingosinicella indica]